MFFDATQHWRIWIKINLIVKVPINSARLKAIEEMTIRNGYFILEIHKHLCLCNSRTASNTRSFPSSVLPRNRERSKYFFMRANSLKIYYSTLLELNRIATWIYEFFPPLSLSLIWMIKWTFYAQQFLNLEICKLSNTHNCNYFEWHILTTLKWRITFH